MGVLPSSQYGSVAVLPSLIDGYDSNLVVASPSSQSSASETAQLLNAASTSDITSSNKISSLRHVRLNSDLSALSIRATEYLQRWKEVVQFASKDYSDQMRAQFGIKAPEYMGNHAHYIGGWSNVININEVLNTNLESDGSQAGIENFIDIDYIRPTSNIMR